MEKVSEELDYSQKVMNHSSTNYRDVSPQDQTTVNLSSSGAVGPSEFQIGGVVCNLAHSRLEFTLSLGATAVNELRNTVSANLLKTISRIVLYDSGTNALLCDINNFDRYADMMSDYAVCKEDLGKRPFLKTKVPPTTTVLAQEETLEDIQRDNTLTATGNILYGRGAKGRDQTAPNTTVNVGDEEIDSPLFFYQGVVNSGAVGSASIIDVSIPLSAFKGTPLAQDNLIYSPTNLVWQIYWNATDSYALATDATNDATNSVSVLTPTISGLNLCLAVEANVSITSKIISKVMSEGITFNSPYASVIKHNVSTSAYHRFTTQLTRAYGNRILYIMVGKYGSGAPKKLYERAIGDMSRYNTTLNSVPIKYPKGYDVKKSEHYVLNREYFKGSTIQSRTLFNQRWVHLDSFFGERSLCTEVDFNDIDGLDVGSQSSLYGWEADFANAGGVASDYFIIVMGHKQLTYTSMGATIQ